MMDGGRQLKDAGSRWIAEIVFSSIKSVLGEELLSKKFKAQKVETGLKVTSYNKFIGLQSYKAQEFDIHDKLFVN